MVLDAGSWVAGPAAATVMADFGADVIKIEPPGGDTYRRFGAMPGVPKSDINYPWLLDARNKKSVVLNLDVPEAREVLMALVRRADVFLTNYPPGQVARLGIGYDALSAMNPRLVYAALTGYGEVGQHADRPAFDVTAWWARSGLMDLVRAVGAPPAGSAPGMGDHPSAIALFAGIMLALYRRERTGRGAKVSSSLMANGAWANAILLQAALCHATFIERPPRDRALNALANSYRCRDGRWFLLTLLREEKEWVPFARAIEREDLLDDPRFATLPARRENSPALVATLDQEFARRDWAQWETVLGARGLTFGAIMRLDDVLADPQMEQNGTIVPLPLAERPGLRTVASPIDVAGETKVTPTRAPDLGEHTDTVLRSLGFGDTDIKRLRDEGALG